MWPIVTRVCVHLYQSYGAFIYASAISGVVDESDRMHILHGPPGSHHLNERQDNDDYMGSSTRMAVNFGAFVKKYYERIVESASETRK